MNENWSKIEEESEEDKAKEFRHKRLISPEKSSELEKSNEKTNLIIGESEEREVPGVKKKIKKDKKEKKSKKHKKDKKKSKKKKRERSRSASSATSN